MTISDQDLKQILSGATQYEEQHPHYDSVFNETGTRLREQGHATKLDIAAVAFWKTINLSTKWASQFLDLPPAEVEKVTREAFKEGLSDGERLSALSPLPGFYNWKGPTGGAIPSTLLCCWNPDDYGVVDIRTREALASLGRPVGGVLEYFESLRELRDAARALDPGVACRHVEKGLFTLAGDRKRR